MQREIPVAPVSAGTKVFLWVLSLVCAGFFFYLYVNSTDGLAPDKARAQLPGLLAVLGLLGVGLGVILWALARCSLTLTASELDVRTGFYRRTLPRSSLLLDKAEEVSLMERREFAPRWRTNGIGLPGFRGGWFRLRNGERALMLLTNPHNVTYLPTSAGYVLVLSTSALLPALRENAEKAKSKAEHRT